jgi:hypothetical protein
MKVSLLYFKKKKKDGAGEDMRGTKKKERRKERRREKNKEANYPCLCGKAANKLKRRKIFAWDVRS